jgi:hypothetical protein
MILTPEQLEVETRKNPHSSKFGTITEVERFPIIQFRYDIGANAPAANGQKELLTVTTPEGEPPDLTALEPLGEAILTPAQITGMASWPAFEAELRALLDIAHDDQHPGQGHGPPDHGGPPSADA